MQVMHELQCLPSQLDMTLLTDSGNNWEPTWVWNVQSGLWHFEGQSVALVTLRALTNYRRKALLPAENETIHGTGIEH